MEDSAYRFGEFSILPAQRALLRGTKSLPLPPKAFDALHLLVRNHGGLVSRDEISRTLWPGIHVTDANLTNIIVQLRKLLGRDAIQTVSKFGYRFTLPVTGEPGVKQASYASFLRAKELITERSLESIQRARELFFICVANDPQFATGWAWLGRTCRVMEKFKGGEPGEPNLARAAFNRAFTLDPDLACAHHFYTLLQVDAGQASQAMTRLAFRLTRHEDPETWAGLVQVLRSCGLLAESVKAHERAVAIDPPFRTSVAHTYFLQCDYANVFEHYVGKGFYLDAAAWAGLGQVDRAMNLLRTRIGNPDLGPFMTDMMGSLLAVLEGKNDEAIAILKTIEVVREPEALFYLARNSGMANDIELTVQIIRRARLGGFWSSQTLELDSAFASLRQAPEFIQEVQEAKKLEDQSRQALQQILGDSWQTQPYSPIAASVS